MVKYKVNEIMKDETFKKDFVYMKKGLKVLDIENSFKELMAISSDFYEYYEVYKDLLHKSYSREINYYLNKIFTLTDIDTMPLLLTCFYDYKIGLITKDVVIDCLKFLLNYLFRFIIAKKINLDNIIIKVAGSMYNKNVDKDIIEFLYYDLFANMFLNDTSYVSNDQFVELLIESDLYNLKNGIVVKEILEIIELSSGEYIDLSGLTIEHIMPQNKDSNNWGELNKSYLYDKYLHTLGNLTLTQVNSSLSDKSYSDKRDILINSKLIVLNKDIYENKYWSYDLLIKRAVRLAGIFLDAIVCKSVKSPSDLHFRKKNINDLNTFTSLRFKRAYIANKPSDHIRNLSDVLDRLMVDLYMKYSKKFEELALDGYKGDGFNKYMIHHNEFKLKDPKEIYRTGIFYESNLDNYRAYKMIRNLLIEFNLGVSYVEFI